jgi:hypothetical protein
MSRSQTDSMFASFVRQIRPVAIDLAEEKYERAKRQLLFDIALHPISIDIGSHGPSPRIGSESGTMFGFLGFEQGSDPIAELINLFEDLIDISVLPPGSGKSLAKVIVSIPTKDALSDLSPLAWNDTPWPILIERGISGLEHYINNGKGNSVSGEGVQVDNVVRSRDFAPEDYLTGIIAKFRQNLKIGK